MTSKIDFYREVLADDPNSRVFFPLSKLLAEQGDTEEAVAVLRRSIGMHPGHIEAKFLLVELLTRQGNMDEAASQFDTFSSLLSNYPGVWTLWAAKAPGLSQDAALALRFLALAMQGGSLSWMDVLEKGLGSLTGQQPKAAPAQASAPADDESFTLRGAEEVMALTKNIEAQQRTLGADMLPPECAAETSAALRTRTMADLLAKHGDYAGAIEIYRDLQRLAASEQERRSINARIEELGAMASSGVVPAKPADAQPKSGAKLVSMLEALANRLDARATA